MVTRRRLSSSSLSDARGAATWRRRSHPSMRSAGGCPAPSRRGRIPTWSTPPTRRRRSREAAHPSVKVIIKKGVRSWLALGKCTSQDGVGGTATSAQGGGVKSTGYTTSTMPRFSNCHSPPVPRVSPLQTSDLGSSVSGLFFSIAGLVDAPRKAFDTKRNIYPSIFIPKGECQSSPPWAAHVETEGRCTVVSARRSRRAWCVARDAHPRTPRARVSPGACHPLSPLHPVGSAQPRGGTA